MYHHVIRDYPGDFSISAHIKRSFNSLTTSRLHVLHKAVPWHEHSIVIHESH